MDFTFNESQDAVSGLAAQIFAGHATTDRVKAVEASTDRMDVDLWSDLAKANLLGIALPERDGGSGLGMIELCLALEQQGRHVAPVPLVWSEVASLAVAEHGSDAERAWLADIVSGRQILTLALAEGGIGDPMEPALNATRSAAGTWVLDGTKLSVPFAHVADHVLVPARVADGVVVAVVEPGAAGLTSQMAEATDRSLVSHLTFDHVEVAAEHVWIDGAPITAWILDRALVGLCALQLGIAEAALDQAASYTSNRLQFGKPLSSFQSAAARAADAYIDISAMRATLWQAAWRLDNGLDAGTAVAVAKWWASEGGQRVVHAAQHLHGGMGADIEYPVHRYFLWGKQIEDTLGGGSAHLARIGRALAAT